MVGYDTFGAQTQSQDANGNVTTTAYDAAGRAVSVTAPAYTPQGSPTPLVPVNRQAYDRFGNGSVATDPLGRETHLDYDQLGNLSSRTAPDGGVTTYRYDTLGEQLSTRDSLGAIQEMTCDYRGRPVTSTELVRQPSPAAYTTQYRYEGIDPGPPGGPWLPIRSTVRKSSGTPQTTPPAHLKPRTARKRRDSFQPGTGRPNGAKGD